METLEERKRERERERGEEGKVSLMKGDFNVRVGRDREGIESTLGPFGEPDKNAEGERLLDMCVRNNLKIMNGFFKHRESHMYTRYRWNEITGRFDQRSVIDYFIISDKTVFHNVKVLPGVSLDA